MVSRPRHGVVSGGRSAERIHAGNLYTEKKAPEKLDYMHKNPVTAGLVEQACDWQWSSARYYLQEKSVGVPLGWVFS